MLIHLSVSNSGSILEEQTLNLLADADKSLPGNVVDLGLPGMKDQRVLKGAVIYGANASGKTNLLLALHRLSEMVTSSHTFEPGKPIPYYEPFLLDDESSKLPTRYNILFVSQGVRYEYEVAYTQKLILEEVLTSYPEGKPRLVFRRVADEANPKIAAWEPPVSSLKDIRELVLPNMLFLSRAANLNKEEVFGAYQWFQDLAMLNLSVNGELKSTRTKFLMYQNKGTPLAGEILSLVRHADFGLVDVTIHEREEALPMYALSGVNVEPSGFQAGLRKRLDAVMSHRGKNESKYDLNYERQSGGTQRFFSLAGPWIEILREGRLLVIDELESSLHPELVRHLLALFMDPEINTKNAQLIFTTHSPLLLDLRIFRRDQIWFAEKGREGATAFYPLTDYSPRKDESILRGYLGGRYGGLPFIPDGLLEKAERVDEGAVL